MATNRQRTRVIAIVHSHVNFEKSGPTGRVVDLSRDLVSLQTSKTTTATGRFQFQLVPRRNYLNLIFPNDVVNIYIDPGDGKRGFVRTLFGYVDRVDRSITTDQDGSTTTTFTVIGSDFQKAIDKTSLYFNAYMRQNLDERFARTSEGAVRGSFRNDAEGSILRNAGVTAYGSPADFIENFLLVLLGFGQQWRLPDVYPKHVDLINQNQATRKQRAFAKIPQNLVNLIDSLGMRRELIDANVEAINNKFFEIGIDVATPTEKSVNSALNRLKAATLFINSPELLAYRASLPKTDASQPISILDLITFDFIESLCIDGFQSNAAITQTGSATLGQFLYGNCNDFINELIFDLRPVSMGPNGKDGGLQGSHGIAGYSTQPDELRVNAEGTVDMPPSAQAIKYVPAVVFREYPYSVVPGLDLTGLMILPAGIDPKGSTYSGTVPFGPIFSVGVEQPGRHIFNYGEPISVVSCQYHKEAKPYKHLDVLTIENSDVISESLGRSDEDTFNVMQLTPQSITNASDQYRSVLTNFSPILNQVSIARHGLRVWEGTTQFANYSSDLQCHKVGGAIDNAQIRRNLVRWSLLMDHWYQHNIEYLSGTITLRGMPEIRVGYRLDWKGRNESYYVEGVSHSWQYPNALQTTVSVARGQRNDPFPVYIPPKFLNPSNEVVQASGDRSETGRLGRFFLIKDTQATTHSTQKEGPFSLGENFIDKISDTTGIRIKAGEGHPLISSINDAVALGLPAPGAFIANSKKLENSKKLK